MAKRKVSDFTQYVRNHAEKHGFESIKAIVCVKGGMCSIGKDEKGFFAYTHRARTKSYPTQDSIPQKELNFIGTTS